MKDMLVISPLPPAQQPGPAAPAARGGSVAPPQEGQGGKQVPEVPAAEPPEIDLSKVVEALNDHLQSVKRDILFSVNDTTGRTVITVLDSESKEVIREIPPESVRALAEYLHDQGMLDSVGVTEKV
ncbi:flagellar biosynthesis protein FlaG [Thioalkalivibrio denitrificans]|uniref:Flagellar biosynthesis protein FlaG n=1 Tax=Thioalkalivibrio denitrificans TaxID=108003 RepID=A0A1V3ND82_9GAMM|nr:flagellar protein FlaG [Thioalkalivibrio denitrificans]OOG22903.1 flagellar biosynthesis protein FlaG [Thioalkalivibrio denitrificans]